MKTISSTDLFKDFSNSLGHSTRRSVVIVLVLLLAIISLASISPAYLRVSSTPTARANTSYNHSTIKYAAVTTAPLHSKTPTPAFYLNTGTPLPPDWANNATETDSIIVGAIILVLIVLVGTLTTVRARK
ncbi:MAG TPA: hypothetical protein VKF38_03450 [Anaerolineaceae bacterium]|nr:hypothetical protein [Anaerolineaceae bacterium]